MVISTGFTKKQKQKVSRRGQPKSFSLSATVNR